MSDAGPVGRWEDESDREARLALVRGERRMAWLYSGAALALVPWIAYLAVTLPKRDLDSHYRAAWVGFDCLLAFVIIRTAYMAFRIDPRVQFPATATATLLLVDAWFDVTTSSGSGATIEAILLAVFLEIPAAVFSLYLARRVSLQVLKLAHFDQFADGDSGSVRRGRRQGGASTGSAQ